MELRPQDFWQRLREGRIPAFRARLDRRLPGPGQLPPLPAQLAARRRCTRSGYRNAELDRLTAEARVSIDPELREQLYRRPSSSSREDCPLIPLYHERIYAAASPRVQGLRLHQTPPQVRFEELWLDAAEA